MNEPGYSYVLRFVNGTMKKFTVQNPLDNLTCIPCRIRAGTKVENVEEAVNVSFAECENMDNEVKCRCYVAEDTKRKTVLQYPGNKDIEFKEIK